MRELRVIHFADLHLGVEAGGRPNPETGLNQRIHDVCDRLDELCRVAEGATAQPLTPTNRRGQGARDRSSGRDSPAHEHNGHHHCETGDDGDRRDQSRRRSLTTGNGDPGNRDDGQRHIGEDRHADHGPSRENVVGAEPPELTERIGTLPSSPSTIRTTSGLFPRGGMKSIARTVPSSVSKIDSRISVSAR